MYVREHHTTVISLLSGWTALSCYAFCTKQKVDHYVIMMLRKIVADISDVSFDVTV